MLEKFRRSVLLFSISAVLSGCATYGEANLLDFNSIYAGSNPVNPQYSLTVLGPGEAEVVMHQGAVLISEGYVRHSYLEKAGTKVAEEYCKGKGGTVLSQSFDRIGSSGWVHVKSRFKCMPSDVRQLLTEQLNDQVIKAAACSASRALKLASISRDIAYIERSALEDCVGEFLQISARAKRLNMSSDLIDVILDYARLQSKKAIRDVFLNSVPGVPHSPRKAPSSSI